MTTIIFDPEFQSLIPPLSLEEFTQLEQNIIADGCRDPLVIWGNILIDGHNRHAICTKHRIPYKTVQKELSGRTAAMDWMDANQLGRRNLTSDQRSYIRGRIYNRTKKTQGSNNQHVQAKSEKSQSDTFQDTASSLAEVHGVSRATIIRDGKKAESIEKLATTAPEQAKAVIEGKKRFNEVRREIKLAEVKETVALPNAKYRVVYADCPWKYGDQLTEDYGAVKFHYPAMTITELCDIPVKNMCSDDAVLFFWVTSPLLFECAPVIKAWGFEYKTSFVWNKDAHNMGHYNSVRHEFLLICTRGSCTPDVKELIPSVQTIKRTKHSEKPEEFRRIIDTLYPHGSRIELFARGQAPEGWDVWGNQA